MVERNSSEKFSHQLGNSTSRATLQPVKSEHSKVDETAAEKKEVKKKMHSTMKQSILISSRLLVIVLIVCAFCTHESFAQQQPLTKEEVAEILMDAEPRVYCSHALNAVMRQVCAIKDRFKPRDSKKSYNRDLESHVFDVDRIGADDIDQNIFDGDYSVISPQQGIRGYRSVTGIIEECCHQPCHKYQLIRYCRSY